MMRVSIDNQTELPITEALRLTLGVLETLRPGVPPHYTSTPFAGIGPGGQNVEVAALHLDAKTWRVTLFYVIGEDAGDRER